VSDGFNQTAQERPSEESSFPVPAFQLTPDSPLKISFLVGDEVTSLKFIRFFKDKLETPYVVSYGRLTDGAAEDVEHFLPASGFSGCLSLTSADIFIRLLLGFLETKKSRDRVGQYGHNILPAVGLNRCRRIGPTSRRGQVG
jgi:hypothetical protein